MRNYIFQLNDTVRYSKNNLIEGKVVDVAVNRNNDTIYALNDNGVTRWFLAKELILVKEASKDESIR